MPTSFPIHAAQGPYGLLALCSRFWECLSDKRELGGLDIQFEVVITQLKARRRTVEAEARIPTADPPVCVHATSAECQR